MFAMIFKGFDLIMQYAITISYCLLSLMGSPDDWSAWREIFTISSISTKEFIFYMGFLFSLRHFKSTYHNPYICRLFTKAATTGQYSLLHRSSSRFAKLQQENLKYLWTSSPAQIIISLQLIAYGFPASPLCWHSSQSNCTPPLWSTYLFCISIVFHLTFRIKINIYVWNLFPFPLTQKLLLGNKTRPKENANLLDDRQTLLGNRFYECIQFWLYSRQVPLYWIRFS